MWATRGYPDGNPDRESGRECRGLAKRPVEDLPQAEPGESEAGVAIVLVRSAATNALFEGAGVPDAGGLVVLVAGVVGVGWRYCRP